eukprot:SAG31_NODE_238_length_19470_cov_8.921532_4_plen_70_part_00
MYLDQLYSSTPSYPFSVVGMSMTSMLIDANGIGGAMVTVGAGKEEGGSAYLRIYARRTQLYNPWRPPKF